MPNLGYRTFESRWVDHSDVKNVVRQRLRGRVLNIPCGHSDIGDVRADIDPDVNPDVIADVRDIPFCEGEFDTIYCDPPYEMLSNKTNSLQWIQDLYRVATERLIVQGPNRALYVGAPADEELLCLKPKPGSVKNWIRVLHTFTKQETTIGDFS